jgi:hypothetical protein
MVRVEWTLLIWTNSLLNLLFEFRRKQKTYVLRRRVRITQARTHRVAAVQIRPASYQIWQGWLRESCCISFITSTFLHSFPAQQLPFRPDNTSLTVEHRNRSRWVRRCARNLGARFAQGPRTFGETTADGQLQGSIFDRLSPPSLNGPNSTQSRKPSLNILRSTLDLECCKGASAPQNFLIERSGVESAGGPNSWGQTARTVVPCNPGLNSLRKVGPPERTLSPTLVW